jgi:predicted tellurium resistance membrane protein TerC
VWIIIVADVIMSLDNVIAVAGASEGDLALVIFGISLSIPIVVWGSGVLATLMNRYPWIILVAGGVLGEVAGKMIVHDAFLVRYLGDVPDWIEWTLRLVLAAGIMLFGWLSSRRRSVEAGEAAAP